jgi:hypothetical protein
MTSAVAQLSGRKAFVSLWRLPLGYDRFLRPALCRQLTAKFGCQRLWKTSLAPAPSSLSRLWQVAAGWLHAAHDHIGTVWQNRVLYSKLPYDLDKTSCPWPFSRQARWWWACLRRLV